MLMLHNEKIQKEKNMLTEGTDESTVQSES